MKQITEVYELDCTGMTMDEVKEEMTHAYVEDRPNWRYMDELYELDHHEIERELVIE